MRCFTIEVTNGTVMAVTAADPTLTGLEVVLVEDGNAARVLRTRAAELSRVAAYLESGRDASRRELLAIAADLAMERLGQIRLADYPDAPAMLADIKQLQAQLDEFCDRAMRLELSPATDGQ